LGVATGAVGQNEAVAIGIFGGVQESHDVGFDGVVSEFADGVGQSMILNPGRGRACRVSGDVTPTPDVAPMKNSRRYLGMLW
jgi:hypothetical protein